MKSTSKSKAMISIAKCSPVIGLIKNIIKTIISTKASEEREILNTIGKE